jgi:hypothetical protein
MNGKIVVVRTFSAGVHTGRLIKRNGKEVILSSARRIWSWSGANTLNEISLHGVGKGSRISEAVSRILLTEAIEILECSKEGAASLAHARWE